MSQRKIKIIVLASAFILFLLVGCSGSGSGAAKQQKGEVFKSVNGLEVKSVDAQAYDLETSEVAKILSIQRWKFTVTPSDTNTKLNFQLEMHDPNGEVKTLSSFTIFPSETTPMNILVAFYPLEGSFFDLAKLKYFIEAGSGSTQQMIDNPFMDFSGYGPSSPAQLDDEGKFLLVRFSKDGSMGTDQDSLLYFRVQEEPSRD